MARKYLFRQCEYTVGIWEVSEITNRSTPYGTALGADRVRFED
jgi:hypothetical protein